MGCCRSELRGKTANHLPQRFREAIEQGNLKMLQDIMKFSDSNSQDSKINLDENLITIKNVSLNALAYALLLGKTEIFKYLVHKLGASVQVMYELMYKQNLCPLETACQKGYVDLLVDIIPVFLSLNKESVLTYEEVSMDFSSAEQQSCKIKCTYTPVHLACERGHINVIGYIYNYFKNNQYCPLQLDIDYQDEMTGENCALIACRIGDYPMIKFLHEVCDANFKFLNKRNENAIQILAVNSKKKTNVPYLECIKYLIETVEIDICGVHEEILLVLENKVIIKYIESKLSLLGIDTTKVEIESKNKIVKSASPKSEKEILLEQFMETNFDIRTYIEGDDDKRSILSSITPVNSRIDTPFISFMDTKMTNSGLIPSNPLM